MNKPAPTSPSVHSRGRGNPLYRKPLLIIAIGLLGGLGFPPFSPLAPLFQLLFLGAMFRFAAEAKGTRPAMLTALAMAFFQGLVAYAWLAEPFQFINAAWAGPPMVALMALYIALYAAMAGWVANYTKSALAFGFAIGWLEWVRSFLFTGFAWNPASAAWVFYLPMLQTLSLFGAFGLSTLTAMTSAWLSRKGEMKYGAAMLAGLFVFGLIRMQEPAHMNLKVRIMNLDHRNPLERDPMSLERFSLLAAAPGAEHIGLFAMPESATDTDLYRNPRALGTVMRMNNPRSVATLGMTRRQGAELFNTLAVVDSGGLLASYDKRHLVPFGEYMPRWLDPFFNKMTAGYVGFSHGTSDPVMHIKNRLIAPLICYEAIFPGLRLRGEPDFIINVSNDAWFAPQGRVQHFELSRMRSIEEGIPQVRVANAGISAIISPYGQISAVLLEQGFKDGMMFAPLRGGTLFGWTGNWLFALIATGVLAWILLKRRQSS